MFSKFFAGGNRKGKTASCSAFNMLRRTASVILVLGMLVSSACTGNNAGGGLDSTTTPQPSYTPQSGGELKLPMPQNASTESPYIVNTNEMLRLYSLVYEGLLSVDETGRLNPSLAESWTADPEQEGVWTITLRLSLIHI